ncbi:PP2C family protein-serine/threonine phosphatase [Phaeacidiphilus oryzae]|uniref:PP2C family protein-serine/threonine phosphatase n=1 Tax=Phaeacidiphilus oryzae TaxID=348818 RepID=UPI00068E3F48|nr:PP2C family protein-serine/threonine phosphatase [Phaeacidiphilus oryzae]
MPRRRDPEEVSEPILTRLRSEAWVLPVAVLVGVVLVGELSGPQLRVANWLLLAPLLAAGVCTPPVTAALGVLVLATNRLVNAFVPTAHLRMEDFALAVVAVLLSITVSLLRASAHDYLERLQGAAETTRQVVLRRVPPGWGGIDSAARYLAADAEARVGGDFYEVLATPFGARVLLGDVQGKGLPAVTTAGAMVGAFREAGYHERDLAVVADRMEVRLGRDNRLRAELGETSERFATAVILAFPEEDQDHVQVVNFGHEGPLAIGPQGVRRLPQAQGPPLGMAELAGGMPPVDRVPLGPDETVLLYTDGTSEARDRRGRFFPVRDWLEARTGEYPDGVAPAELLTRLVEALLAHTGGRLGDDTALLAVRRLPAGSRPPCSASLPGAGSGLGSLAQRRADAAERSAGARDAGGAGGAHDPEDPPFPGA